MVTTWEGVIEIAMKIVLWSVALFDKDKEMWKSNDDRQGDFSDSCKRINTRDVGSAEFVPLHKILHFDGQRNVESTEKFSWFKLELLNGVRVVYPQRVSQICEMTLPRNLRSVHTLKSEVSQRWFMINLLSYAFFQFSAPLGESWWQKLGKSIGISSLDKWHQNSSSLVIACHCKIKTLMY